MQKTLEYLDLVLTAFFVLITAISILPLVCVANQILIVIAAGTLMIVELWLFSLRRFRRPT